MSRFILVFVIISCSPFAKAQRKFEFNSANNPCFFEFYTYAQNGNYSSIRRPFIFVIPASDNSAAYQAKIDSLKENPKYYNYEFVFVPSLRELSYKTECIQALVSLITYDFKYGKSNVFLVVNDSTFDEVAIQKSGLNNSFSTVRFMFKEKISQDFKETFIDYESIDGKEEEEQGGTLYVEENKTEDEKETVAYKRTYFGPPVETNFTLSGFIKDKATGESLSFSTIQLKGNVKGTTANADGFFTLKNVPNDTCTLLVRSTGYSAVEFYLSPIINKKNCLIELRPFSKEIKEVKVSANREDVVLAKKEEVSMIKLTPRKLETLPSLGERDIMRSFQLMPGVSAANESSSGLYVRGGTPDQNLVLFDGFTVYHVDHLYGFFSAFNSNAIKDVQLYKGGFESRFGGRLSSVTEITGKEGNQKKFNIGGDLSLLSMNVFAEIPIGEKFSSVVSFRRSYKGLIYNKIFSKFSSGNDTQMSTTGGGPGGFRQQNTKTSSYFYDLNGKFTYRPTQKDVLSLSVFNGADWVDNSSSFDVPSFGGDDSKSFSSTTTDLTNYGNIGTSLRWSRIWKEGIYSNTIASFSNYYSNRDRTQDRIMTDEDGNETTSVSGIQETNNLKDYSLKTDLNIDLPASNKLQIGFFATVFDIDYRYRQGDTLDVLNKSNLSMLTGLYVQDKWSLFQEKLQITGGIRSSYFAQTGKIYNEPRLSLSWKINSNFTFVAASGKYYQFVNRVTREDILSGSKDFWLLSDGSSVPVSSSEHFISGLSYSNSNYLFSVEGYWKNLHDITEYSLRFNPSPMGTNYDENFFTGSGQSRGIEFLAQKKSGNLNGWASYTLGQARNKFSIYSDSYFSANQDVTHEFKAVAMYRYKRWDFSATWVYATGRPYTAPSGAYSVTLLDGNSTDYFTVTTKNGLRLPDYHRGDISVTYKLISGYKGVRKRREIGYIGFSIFNVYNRKNVWYKQYTIADDTVIETNVNYMGITPNLTLSFKLR